MSHRSRASKVRQHVHCDSCYSRRCRARVEVSVSCAVIPCRLLCGALFHLCKEEDHLLLCPNVRVPCLNSEFGCPVHLPRSSQAAHLLVCPASVVCCSMEWNRWPADDAHSHLSKELHENLIRGREQGGCLNLDLAMALKDQDRLFHSIKMKGLFPELIQSVEEEEEKKKKRRKEKQKQKILEKKGAEKVAWESFNSFNIHTPVNKEEEEEYDDDDDIEVEQELTQEEREAIASESGVAADLLANYSAWERMFSMEMGGCREAGVTAGAGQGKTKEKREGLGTVMEEGTEDTCVGATAANTCKMANSSCSGSSISSSSSCPSVKIKKKKFVYGHVEPMKIIIVRTFKIPTSYSARHGRIRNPGFYKRESKAVDTSDLGVALEDMPVWDEVQASLLCSLENEQRGHLIAESVCTDGLLQDEGTQTYNFLSTPFHRSTSLADLTARKPLELHLQLQVESVTSRHHKATSAFTFLCGHTFQRREYGKHYKNIHSDIQMCVNGWFEQRCPLAYLGCTYSQKRFQPSTHEATVNYNEDLGCFSLHPAVPVSLDDVSQNSMSTADSSAAPKKRGVRGGGGGGEGKDSLSTLPYEVLCHMASFLDSLSLSQLALVSQLMRQVCWSLLQERGMVTLCWERETDSHGGAKWRVKQRVWQFSTLFSPVDTWCFRDVPPMSEHLKECPYYERESRTEKVQLPRVRAELQTHNTSCKGPTLVTLFQHKRIMM
ncbi:F-box only protein 40-like [Parambassis ranga]|uniref:F-box only protein 40-like n=1 Tax=Parambassis ranga TaxID=210632 RepID=A0A6P7JJW4_9TELE|nr:F-box only protein 40-like [Parambassis ranga]XP_028277151.1 F-box only protein 40-like [Parambassis ranga]